MTAARFLASKYSVFRRRGGPTIVSFRVSKASRTVLLPAPAGPTSSTRGGLLEVTFCAAVSEPRFTAPTRRGL